jgi:flagellar biogenesis protein FliO
MTLSDKSNPSSNMLVDGLCGGVVVLLTAMSSVWGQSVPTAGNYLPRQFPSEDNHTVASTAGRSRPLIAFRRDKLETEMTTAPLHEKSARLGQGETLIRDPSIAPAVHDATAAILPTEISKRIPPSPEVIGNNLAARSQSDLDDPRRLLPSSNSNASNHTNNRPINRASSNSQQKSGIANRFPSMDILRTAGTGLGIAVGLLLLCTWLFRRNTPSPTTQLPNEVVSVLGRTQLATRQFVQLLRVGNKLVLIAATAEGTEALTEITDPVEVDRLLGLCMRNHSQSTTAEFQQVLNQLSREGAKGFLEKS